LALFLAVVAGAPGAAPLDAQSGRYERLRCESRNNREQFCQASIDGDVRVVRQLSDTACREGRTWRWDRNGITVRDGCRAEFEYRRRDSGWGGSGGGWGGGAGYDVVTCQSTRGREDFCPAPIAGDVRVSRQLSEDACTQERTWNWNRDGIRVYDGCRAEFRYRRRSGELNPAASNLKLVTCQSQKDREQFCPAPIEGGVRVFRRLSDTTCREGANWSWTREGVRVWRGCRAEFEYRSR
jgi:hypothetical protein